MSETNCIYCGKKITVPSEEHIIHNALGGRLKSTNICCGKCNNEQVSHILDKPFVDVFSPITSNIPLFSKQKNSGSVVPYQAIAEFNGKKYDVTIKGNTVSCPELSRQLKCDVSKLPGWKILYHKFNVDNDAFRNGISKIALNYALACDISPDFVRHGIHIEKTNDIISKIDFSFPSVPYVPLNSLDIAMDIAPIRKMTHNLILFNQQNKLWCYVDLFDTFQYYVLLSENFTNETPIYKTYSQTFQRTDTSFIDKMFPSDCDIRASYKDIASIALQYSIKPSFNIAELTRQIEAKMYARTFDETIYSRFCNINIFDIPTKEIQNFYKTQMFYFKTSDSNNLFVIPGTYRALTVDYAGKIQSYPEILNMLYHENPDTIRRYTNIKFDLLNYYLVQNKKTK